MLTWLVIIPIVIACSLYILPFEKIIKIISIITQSVLAVISFSLFLMCKEAPVVTSIGNYQSVLGITLKADLLSSVFIMLTSFVFLCAAIYSFQEKIDKLFWFLLFVWESVLIGIFLSEDLFNIFVLTEVVTVVVAIHIMLKRDKRSMYDGIIYFMINIIVMQFYLFGTGYIYKITGTMDLNAAAEVLATADKSSLILPYALILTAIALKCALFPLYNWLPKAHGTPGAPSAVSAILSGLHIKAGVYLFLRFQELFIGVSVSEFFLVIGIITGILGFIFALSQTDIKLILAYHTISQIGMIMIGLNTDDLYSYTGAVYHMINHAVFKSALFLCAGSIIRIYGTRNLYEIRGVLKRNPMIGIATLMAVFGITGTPFFNGSISKYFIMSGTDWIVNGALMLINLGTIVSFIKYSTMLFGKCENNNDAGRADVFQQVAVLMLGTLCFAGGIFGEDFILFLFDIDLSVDRFGYLQKTLIFAASCAAGLLIYKYFIKSGTLLKKVRKIDLSFRAMCVSIGLFMAVLLIVTQLVSG